MKSKLIGILIGLTLGLLIHFALRLFYSYEFLSHSQTSVTIKNKSGHLLTTLQLKHKGGTLQASNIYDSEEIRFIFPSSGENSYNVIATLDNDSVIESQGVYFERGYRGTETVTSSKIITDNNW